MRHRQLGALLLAVLLVCGVAADVREDEIHVPALEIDGVNVETGVSIGTVVPKLQAVTPLQALSLRQIANIYDPRRGENLRRRRFLGRRGGHQVLRHLLSAEQGAKRSEEMEQRSSQPHHRRHAVRRGRMHSKQRGHVRGAQ